MVAERLRQVGSLLVKLVIIGYFYCSLVRNFPGGTFFVHMAILIGEINGTSLNDSWTFEQDSIFNWFLSGEN